MNYTPKGLRVTIIASYGARITAPPGDFTLVEKSDTLSMKDYITYKSSTYDVSVGWNHQKQTDEEYNMTLKVGDRVEEFGNKMAPSANGQTGTVVAVGDQPIFGYRDINVKMDNLVAVVAIPENRLRLIKEYEPLAKGERVEFIDEDGDGEVLRGKVKQVDQGSIVGRAVVHVEFDDGDGITGMEYEFTKIKGTKADKESRFEEGQEVVVSDPEMRCYGEHGIVESVQVMEEFGSSPVLLVKLLDPVEYLVYGEDCFQSLGDFYADSDEEDDEDIIGLGDTVVLDMADHEHAGKRGKVMNVGYFDEGGVEHVQVVLFYDGQVVIEPRDAFTLITEDELVHEDQMLMSLQDPNEVYSMLEEADEHVEGKLFDELAGALEDLVEQEKSKRKGEPSLEEQGIKSLIEITYNDGTRVHTLSEYEADGLRAKLLASFSDGGSILIGEIVTKVGDIKHVRISDVEEN